MVEKEEEERREKGERRRGEGRREGIFIEGRLQRVRGREATNGQNGEEGRRKERVFLSLSTSLLSFSHLNKHHVLFLILLTN